MRFLEQSKERWELKAKQREAELRQLEARLREVQRDLEALKKDDDAQMTDITRPQIFEEELPFHHYSNGHALWFVSLVLFAAVSLRASSEAMQLTSMLFGLPIVAPSWSSGRLWLLRLGYYKLHRAKEKADDWVWIVDHFIEGGQQKCLLVVGVRLSCLEEEWKNLGHEDIEPILIEPVESSNGEIVYQQLEAAAKKTGVPREIVSDHGSDLKKGIEEFCRRHKETSHIYDIKHQTAIVLKRELERDVVWEEYWRKAAETQKIQQSEINYMAPPEKRQKARYMNVDKEIEWGVKVLRVVEEIGQSRTRTGIDRMIFESLGWVRAYSEDLREWEQMLEVVKRSEEFVRREGLYRGCEEKMKKEIKVKGGGERAERVRKELVSFVRGEGIKSREGERLVGSSEVIESVIGKLKRVKGEQVRRGVTELMLSAAAMVSKTTAEVTQQAMSFASTREVREWCKQKIGRTKLAKRKEALSRSRRREQNGACQNFCVNGIHHDQALVTPSASNGKRSS
jgi:hypothetical protein